MIAVGDKKEVVLLAQMKGQRWYRLVCFGRKRHYRQDGTCKHTDAVLNAMSPARRKVTHVDLWGGKLVRDADRREGGE